MPQAKAPDGPGIELSKRRFCEIMGWTDYTFDQWVRKGLPVKKRPANRQDDYLLDSGVAIRWLLAQARGVGELAAGEPEALDYNVEKARLTKEQADKTQLENEAARRELLPAAEVARTYETVFTALRDRVMSVASVAPTLRDAALKDDVAGVRAVLLPALAQALDEVGSAELVEKPAAA